MNENLASVMIWVIFLRAAKEDCCIALSWWPIGTFRVEIVVIVLASSAWGVPLNS